MIDLHIHTNYSDGTDTDEELLRKAEADNLYVLKMDIESFFPSLYTHNFEKMHQKMPFVQLGASSKYFKFLDIYHQRINNNQTKGIPAGVFSSQVTAELCMLCVDYEINSFISEKQLEVEYIRYVDDLTFFSDYEHHLTQVFPAVQNILNRFRLRINGNKTESMPTIRLEQSSYFLEVERKFSYLKYDADSTKFDLNEFFEFKKYVVNCLDLALTSQLKTLLSMLRYRIAMGKIDYSEVESELFYFLVKVVFANECLTLHVYRLLDELLKKCSTEEIKKQFIESLVRKLSKIDGEYPDTILQIWHYYLLFKYSNGEERDAMIKRVVEGEYGPLVVTTAITSGKGKNRVLFNYIKERYLRDIDDDNWKASIMYSKWWLPIFRILRYDGHNYDNFFDSNNIPSVLKEFPLHVEEDDSWTN